MTHRRNMTENNRTEGKTTVKRSSRETRNALCGLTVLGQLIQREAERWLLEHVVLRTPAELALFHKALVDGNTAERSMAVRSFTLAWPATQQLSAIDLVHLACILNKLTAVERLELPVACTSHSVVDYDFGPSTGEVRTFMPPSMFMDLFEEMCPLPHLRTLDVTLALLVRIPREVRQQVACLTLRITAQEQPRACSAVSTLFGENLRNLRIMRSCFGRYPGPQESPARICAALDMRGLTYFELRDIDILGTCTAGSADVLANTMDADDALHKVPMVTTIVWEPCWARSCSRGTPSYQKLVRQYLEDLMDIFGEALVFICEDGTSAQCMGSDLRRLVGVTKTEVEDWWWEIDSWGERWSGLLRAV